MKYVPMGTSEGIKQIARGSGDLVLARPNLQPRSARKGT